MEKITLGFHASARVVGKEVAYWNQTKLPLVDPRSSSTRALRIEQLQELAAGHQMYLQVQFGHFVLKTDGFGTVSSAVTL